jgi:hypothetical protein
MENAKKTIHYARLDAHEANYTQVQGHTHQVSSRQCDDQTTGTRERIERFDGTAPCSGTWLES